MLVMVEGGFWEFWERLIGDVKKAFANGSGVELDAFLP